MSPDRLILITGAAGFVGRAFTRWIRRNLENVHLVGVDDFSEGREEWDKQELYTQFDRFWEMDVRAFLKRKQRFDLCIHLAARVGGRLEIENRAIDVAENLAIDQAVIAAVHGGMAKELMYFSSSAAYPTCWQKRRTKRLLSEDMIALEKSAWIGRPDMTYGWAKVTGEYLCSFLADTQVTIFRPFSGYGTDQGLAYPFPAIMQRVVDGEDPVVVWGSGTQCRDWIHINDICRMAFELHQLHGGGTYNLGTGIPVKFIDFASRALAACDKQAAICHNKSKPEGVYWRVADMAKTHACRVRANISLDEGMHMWREGVL